MNNILDNKSILVVEDDWKNREFVVSTIQTKYKKCKLLSASNGNEAIEILNTYTIDLIILDLEMPVMNGITLLRKLKDDLKLNNIPVIVYTGVLTDNEHLKETLELGAVDFLRKPTATIEIIARVISAIKQKQVAAENIELIKEKTELESLFLRNQITELNNNLKNQMLLLAQKNEVLLKLKELIDEKKDSNINNIQKIILSTLVEQNYWDNFLQQFNKIEPGFVKLLQSEYESLTINEVRLCALIRIGIENKAISSILQVSPAAIEKARYRIRKKINLSQRISLEKALFEIK
jgi:DNA-binding response OmpR family regulator/DNA-binding CsgD family transcriptional regulator